MCRVNLPYAVPVFAARDQLEPLVAELRAHGLETGVFRIDRARTMGKPDAQPRAKPDVKPKESPASLRCVGLPPSNGATGPLAATVVRGQATAG